LGVAAAILGRSDDVKFLIPNQIHTEETPVLINRMTLREGVQTTGLQRIGRAADALHLALCQSVTAGPGKTPVIRVFPAWPSQWDATYRLLARGAFLVSSSMKNGQIEFVEVQSQVGGECRLRNPWGDRAKVTLYRNGTIWKNMKGQLLRFGMRKGENIVVLQKSVSADQLKRIILNEDG